MSNMQISNGNLELEQMNYSLAYVIVRTYDSFEVFLFEVLRNADFITLLKVE